MDASSDQDSQVSLIPEGVDVGAFMLRTPMEIGYTLRSLAQRRELISVYFDRGQSSFLTTILDADVKSQRFCFDVSSVDAINRSFLRADRMVFVADPEGVKIQFVVESSASLTNYDGDAAFIANFPADLIKLQRREFFRLDTPIGKPLICKLPHSSGKLLELPLHDISIGGVGVWAVGHYPFEQGEVFHHCRIDLGTFGMLDVSLEVRGKREVTQKNGAVQTMMGFRFVNLPRHIENVLQRFIAQLERERHQLLKR